MLLQPPAIIVINEAVIQIVIRTSVGEIVDLATRIAEMVVVVALEIEMIDEVAMIKVEIREMRQATTIATAEETMEAINEFATRRLLKCV